MARSISISYAGQSITVDLDDSDLRGNDEIVEDVLSYIEVDVFDPREV